MKFKDFYQSLGVPETATPDEIKRAYRKKARKYHPDVSSEPGAEERFKEISEAYETLKDEQRRTEYDQLRRYGFKDGDDIGNSSQWGGAGGYGTDAYGNADFSELFESIFGNSGFGQAHGGARQRHHRSWPQQGDDVNLTVRVSLENAFRGGKTRIKVPGNPVRQISVNIPAGVSDGRQLRLKAQGGQGINGGPPGDLLLTIAVKPHNLFQVEGNSVILSVPLTPFEAATGLKLTVPTLGGAVSVTIPPNTRSGSKMRLKGKGLADSGDQIVVIQIQLPENMSARALALLKQLDEECADETRAHFEQAPTG